MATNNALNNQCLSDFTVTRSNSGGLNVLSVINTSNTASSSAIVRASVAGTSGGDALHQAVITGGTTWSWGPDTSDSAKWKLNPSSAIGSGDLLSVTTAGNFTFNFLTSGATGGLIVNNTSNTASSQAYVTINTAGTSAGKQILQFSNTVDSLMSISRASATNSPLIFSAGNPGTNDNLTIDNSGRVSNALQTYFSVALTTTTTNQTGDGTGYTPIIMASVFNNVGSAYNAATGVFTAPITTKYQFDSSILVSSLGALHTQADFNFNFNGGSFFVTPQDWNPAVIRTAVGGDSNNLGMGGSIQIQLSAGDTVQLQLNVSGSTKTVGAFASPGRYSYWMGRAVV